MIGVASTSLIPLLLCRFSAAAIESGIKSEGSAAERTRAIHLSLKFEERRLGQECANVQGL
jgi:hypothetical protein